MQTRKRHTQSMISRFQKQYFNWDAVSRSSVSALSKRSKTLRKNLTRKTENSLISSHYQDITPKGHPQEPNFELKSDKSMVSSP